MRKVLKCCAVKAPGYGDRRKAMLEDIAALTGGKALIEDLGIDLKTVELTDLGSAKRVSIDKENTTIVEGAGKRADVQDRIKKIRAKSTTPLPTTIARSCKSAWPSWPVVLP